MICPHCGVDGKALASDIARVERERREQRGTIEKLKDEIAGKIVKGKEWAQMVECFNLWIDLLRQPPRFKPDRYKLTPKGKRAKALRARLREDSSAEEIKRAILGNSLSEWHTSNGENATELELIVRCRENVEKFMGIADEYEQAKRAAEEAVLNEVKSENGRGAAPTVPLDRFLAALRKREVVYERALEQDGWYAFCPAHAGVYPLLRIGDEPLRLECAAGCPVNEILYALGIEYAEVWPTLKLPVVPPELTTDELNIMQAELAQHEGGQNGSAM